MISNKKNRNNKKCQRSNHSIKATKISRESSKTLKKMI